MGAEQIAGQSPDFEGRTCCILMSNDYKNMQKMVDRANVVAGNNLTLSIMLIGNFFAFF